MTIKKENENRKIANDLISFYSGDEKDFRGLILYLNKANIRWRQKKSAWFETIKYIEREFEKEGPAI